MKHFSPTRVKSINGTRLKKIWSLYSDGFSKMTWGRPLWILILLKLFILFFILRIFFFKPVMAGKDDEQKSEYIGEQLVREDINTEILEKN